AAASQPWVSPGICAALPRVPCERPARCAGPAAKRADRAEEQPPPRDDSRPQAYPAHGPTPLEWEKTLVCLRRIGRGHRYAAPAGVGEPGEAGAVPAVAAGRAGVAGGLTGTRCARSGGGSRVPILRAGLPATIV